MAEYIQSDKLKWVGFEGVEWEVHKFGGTSVASAECFNMVADIVEAQIGFSTENGDVSSAERRTAVVLSAMGGKPKVTDLLLSTVKAAAARESEEVDSILDMILKKHFDCIDSLPLASYEVPDPKNNDAWTDAASLIKKRLTSDIRDLKDILKTVSLMKWQASRISELVSGYGELWSTQILAMLLSSRAARNADTSHHRFAYIDARRVIIIEEEAVQNGAVSWEMSKEYLNNVYKEECEYQLQMESKMGSNKNIQVHLVVTGYVASNTEGVATTLQRDGSDYSAAIMGRLLEAHSINIWTDVDGVLSADPRRVPTAFPIPEVSYNEAMELAYFGAKVIHPKTMTPAIMSSPQIPIYIKNTFYPLNAGTRIYITSTTHNDGERCVCGFSTVEDMALINVEGSGMVGVKGVANRLFGALEHSGVNVVLISQASSEHSITFATKSENALKAKVAIEETFAKEIRQQHINEIAITTSCAIIAAVGDGMSAVAGVAGRFFSALGNSEINVLGIAQGSSERNISAVIKMEDSTRALRAVHAAFRLSNVNVRVGIVGMNDIGKSLLGLLHKQHGKLRETFDINLQICAILNDSSSSEVITLQNSHNEDESIDPQSYQKAINKEENGSKPKTSSLKGGIAAMTKYVKSEECAHAVIIDCTGDKEVGKFHPIWLDANVHVITANNSALSGPRSLRTDIRIAETKNGKLSANYLPEVTVGGALPVLNTLKNLLTSGDKIKRVSGIFSTSLSYIMHRIAPPPGFAETCAFDEFNTNPMLAASKNSTEACTFSQAVDEARALGLMEENPLKDLSNEYTARCLMVIAKELGMDKDYDTEQIQLMSDMLMVDVEKQEGKGAVKMKLSDLVSYDDVHTKLDALMERRVSSAREKGCVPRHISTIDVKTGKIEVSIVDVPFTHIYATTPPSCECVRFFTENLKEFPLVVQVSIYLDSFPMEEPSSIIFWMFIETIIKNLFSTSLVTSHNRDLLQVLTPQQVLFWQSCCD